MPRNSNQHNQPQPPQSQPQRPQSPPSSQPSPQRPLQRPQTPRPPQSSPQRPPQQPSRPHPHNPRWPQGLTPHMPVMPRPPSALFMPRGFPIRLSGRIGLIVAPR